MIAPQVAWPVALQDAIYIGGRAAGWQRKLLLLQISVENFAKNGGRCRVGVISDRLEISIRSSLSSEKRTWDGTVTRQFAVTQQWVRVRFLRWDFFRKKQSRICKEVQSRTFMRRGSR
jgi:hypothetical protein